MRHSKRDSHASTRATTSGTQSRPRSLRANSSNKNLDSKAEPITTVLYLEQNHARFNAPSKRESIFFDESNREIIGLTSNVGDKGSPGKTRVVFQRTDELSRAELILPIEKRILSIKSNSTKSVIAYHVERNIIEFINVKSRSSEGQSTSGTKNSILVLDDKRYVQSSRAKNSKLIGFLWTGPCEVVIITDLSIEYYHVDASRRRLNHLKFFQSATNWFVYQPTTSRTSSRLEDPYNVEDDVTNPSEGCDNLPQPYSLLIVSTGSLGNSMQPYMFSGRGVTKLQKFDVEGDWHDSDKLELSERSITVGFIYGHVRLLVLQHESLNVKSKGAQIVLYTVDTESGTTTKTHTLDLDTSGRFAINIIENLVVVHDQPSKTSFIFDIAIESTEKSDCPNHFVSLIGSRPIRNLELADYDCKGKRVDMYSLNWVFFQPNFIVDAKLGLLCILKIDLEAMRDVLQDNLLILNFLVHRENSEMTILKLCKEIVLNSYRMATSQTVEAREIDGLNTGIQQRTNPLAEVSSAFETLSHLVKSAPRLPERPVVTTTKSERAKPDLSGRSEFRFRMTIQQDDVDREIFRHLIETAMDELDRPAHFHFVSSVLQEFIFAVRCRNDKNVDFCIYERLVRCLVRGKRFFQIIQMIRSHILEDSKQLACLLISVRDQYKPAVQLGLDMFHRLPCGPPPSNLADLM